MLTTGLFQINNHVYGRSETHSFISNEVFMIQLHTGRWVAVMILLVSPVLGNAETALEQRLSPLIEQHKGQVGAMVKNLRTGVTFAWRADHPMPTASLIKIAVMVEVYRQVERGRIELDDRLRLTERDIVPGSGILRRYFSRGTRLPLRDAVRLMIAVSDNTATNLVLDHIGLKKTNETMDRMGFRETRLHAKVFRSETSIDPERSQRFGLGSTTASEMVKLLEAMHQGAVISKESSQEMLEHLRACESKDRIPRYLPEGTVVAHKTGSVSHVRTDAGIMDSPAGPIAICVLTANNDDRRWGLSNDAGRLIADVARRTWLHFNPRVLTPRPVTLDVGESGWMVEVLQRTLNVRLQPSPRLTVDGEFGQVTRRAVKAFQKNRNLVVTGTVGPATWKQLGTLVTQDPPVPDPEQINQEKLVNVPADSLNGPPFVTCRAWAVADGLTGEVLWQNNADDRLDIASTTKMMTAYVVLVQAREKPSVLDETVLFSHRADDTRGSSARIHAGEQLTVRELLYGLMLPSGNDASVALGEHFGGRFEAAEGENTDRAEDPLWRFVAEMNRRASHLDMSSTHYANTHGLTATGHLSSARDLLKLAQACWKLPMFRAYVGTRQHGARLVGSGGSQRNILWRNTNRLLPINGFDGIKTGTTSAAGACLVSTGTRGTDRLFVVVLGSAASASRYADSRNLYRWAWRQRRNTK